jgi:hypothetical protein
MSSKGISHLSDIATQRTNAANVETPILEIQPDNGTMLSLLNMYPSGDAPGLPVIMDLRDSNGNQLSTGSSVVVTGQQPTDDKPVTVATKEDNIAAWNNLTVKEQRNEENIDAVKIELAGDRVNIRDKDKLFIEVESPDQIDWANSELYIPRKGVEKQSYEG